jgi:hypothetical protein
MKTLVVAAFTALSLAVTAANGTAGAPQPYHAPAQNYYQNNWMSGR